MYGELWCDKILKMPGFSKSSTWILEKNGMLFASLVGSVLEKANTSALCTTQDNIFFPGSSNGQMKYVSLTSAFVMMIS